MFYKAVADPGFPVGGGGVDLRRGCFSVKMYAKTKELGPIGGGVRPVRPPDPPMQSIVHLFTNLITNTKCNPLQHLTERYEMK